MEDDLELVTGRVSANAESFETRHHGAGRATSRTAARKAPSRRMCDQAVERVALVGVAKSTTFAFMPILAVGRGG